VIGIVGLGRIGLGVVRLATAKGGDVIAYDVAAIPPETLPAGLKIAPSLAALAESCEHSIVAVYDDQQVLDCMFGEGGIVSSAVPGSTVVILSTVSLNTIRDAALRAAEHGIAVLDCGVSAGVAFSNGAPLAVAVGGDPSVFEQSRAVLELFGSPVLYMGALGSGMTAKLARNLLHYCSGVVDREAARLATTAGVGLSNFVDFVAAAERNGAGHMRYVHPSENGSIAPPGLPPASYATKDLRAALDLARELGMELPSASLALTIFDS
jgi:3-hydroxyisobutyrate dehydrogenase-like beta-hydroxyacid dehydrogenase